MQNCFSHDGLLRYKYSNIPLFQNKIINEINKSINFQYSKNNKNNKTDSSEFYRNAFQKIGKFAIDIAKINEFQLPRKVHDYHKVSSVYRNLSNDKECFKTSYPDSKNNYKLIFQNWAKKTINSPVG